MVLFIITAVTTTAVGALQANQSVDSWLLFFLRGWIFSVPLLTILLAHEMGHYLTGRRHHLDLTPPYFLPGIPPFGTFGAFIKIRSPIQDCNVLMKVGAGGPVAGSVVAIPLLAVGLYLSELRVDPVPADSLSFGSSILLELMCLIRFGSVSSALNIGLHPTALAAWFGLLVTSVNLLPIGQLDGGHVIYALFGPRRARIVSIVTFCCMIPLGLLVCEAWLGFTVVALIVGLKHPPPLDSYTPLDRTAKMLGVAAIVLLVLTFIPAPITLLK